MPCANLGKRRIWAYVRPMRKLPVTIIVSILLTLSLLGCQDASDGPQPAQEKTPPAKAEKPEAKSGYEQDGRGCEPEFRALFDQAVVELRGTGELDIVVVTDPLCWHCRLGHKLLSEYPEKYGRLRLSFFPRRGFIGSNMAAWILEDVAGTDRVRPYVDYAYTDLKQPKTKDLAEARMLVLAQFVEKFPELLDNTNLEELYVRMQRDHGEHVAESARMSRQVELPGTPTLIAGKAVLVGYGPAPWLGALDAKNICE